MATLEQRPIRVTTVGMNERMRNTLRLFFQGPCKNSCTLVEESSAEAGIIDLDVYGGQNLWADYRKHHPEQTIILLSLHETEVENEIFLLKPLNPQQFIDALERIRTQSLTRLDQPEPEAAPRPSLATPTEPTEEPKLPPKVQPNKPLKDQTPPTTHRAAQALVDLDVRASIGSAPDIDPNDPQQITKAQYNPAEFLQGCLQKAYLTADSESRCVQLDLSNGSIIIPPGNHEVLLWFTEKKLRSISCVPLIADTYAVLVLEQDKPPELDGEKLLMSREALIWKTALWASRGRVPVGTDLKTPVYLYRWPNMTRLLVIPHALRIAALWAEQPRSLIHTAKTLGIPQRYVFSFFSAADTLGLASTSQRTSDTLIEPGPVKQHRKHNLLGKILNSLRMR